MLARPFVYPSGGNTSSCIANLSLVTSCHKYEFSTLDVFPDDWKGKNLGSKRVSNILINKK